jgi:hypothetical protein
MLKSTLLSCFKMFIIFCTIITIIIIIQVAETISKTNNEVR